MSTSSRSTAAIQFAKRSERGPGVNTTPELALPDPHRVMEDTAYQHRLTVLLCTFEAERSQFKRANAVDLAGLVSAAAGWIRQSKDILGVIPPDAEPAAVLETADQFLTEAERITAGMRGWRSLFGVLGRLSDADERACIRLLAHFPGILSALLKALTAGFQLESNATQWLGLLASFQKELQAEMSWASRAAAKKSVLK